VPLQGGTGVMTGGIIKRGFLIFHIPLTEVRG